MAKSGEVWRVSHHLISALKLHDDPAYKIAFRAGLAAPTLSRLITGAEPVRGPADARVLAVAEVLGVPASRAVARARRT